MAESGHKQTFEQQEYSSKLERKSGKRIDMWIAELGSIGAFFAA